MSLAFLTQFEVGSTLHSIEMLRHVMAEEDGEELPRLTRVEPEASATIAPTPATVTVTSTLGFLAQQEVGTTPAVAFLRDQMDEEDNIIADVTTKTAAPLPAVAEVTPPKKIEDEQPTKKDSSAPKVITPTTTLAMLAAIDDCTTLGMLARLMAEEDTVGSDDMPAKAQPIGEVASTPAVMVAVPVPPPAPIITNTSFGEPSTPSLVTPSRLPKPKPFTMLGTAVGAGSPSLIIAGRLPPPLPFAASPTLVLQHFDCNEPTPGRGGDILPPRALMQSSHPPPRRLSPREMVAQQLANHQQHHHSGTAKSGQPAQPVLMDDPNRSDYVSRWFEKLYYRKALVLKGAEDEGENNRDASNFNEEALGNVKVVPVAEFLPPRSVMEHHYGSSATTTPQAPSSHGSHTLGIRAELFQQRLAEVLDRSALTSAAPSAIPSVTHSVQSSAIKPPAQGHASRPQHAVNTLSTANLIIGPAPSIDVVTSPVRRINLLSAARKGRASAPPQPLQPKALAFDDASDDIREDTSEDPTRLPRHLQALRGQQDNSQPAAGPVPLSPASLQAKASPTYAAPLHRYARPQSPAAPAPTGVFPQQRRSLLGTGAPPKPMSNQGGPSSAKPTSGTPTPPPATNSRVSMAIQAAQRIARDRSQSAGKRR